MTPFNKFPFTGNKGILLLFLFFTAISLSMILSGYTFLDDNDDLILWSFLTDGESRTMIMSYPLSILISTLYSYFPQIQWYSLTIFLYFSLISLLFSLYISQLNDKFLKILSIMIAIFILIHAWLEVSVTMLALLLAALSMPLVRNHQVAFWGLLIMASFLRVGILFSLIPLFGITYVLLFKKESLSYQKLITIFVLCCVIIFNFISPSFDKGYKEWMQYNKARAYFIDLKGSDKNNILSDDEKFLVSQWWAQDDTLLSTEKVIKAAGTVKDAVIYKFYKITKSFRYFLHVVFAKIRSHKLLIFLILFTFYITYKENIVFHKVLYLLFILGFFTLIILRDHDRVTFPLIILWSILVFLKLQEKQKNVLSKVFLLIAIPILVKGLPMDRIFNKKENEKLRTEFIHLANKHSMKYEVSTGFPRAWIDVAGIDVAGKVFKQSQIFDERQWIHCSRDKIMLSSWVARHPYFYKFHDISFEGYKRKYNNYYEFLLDNNTGFIGLIKADRKINDVILRMYDEKYFHQENCYHVIKVLNESEHFSITQLVKKCDK